MSRLPSFFTVSSGNAQLLQNVLIPRACNSSYNNQQFWNARADLSNIGTLYATTVVASNFSGGTAGINTDQTKGTTYVGEGSDIGTYTTESNIAAYGTTVLGGNGQSTFAHGPVSNVVAVGAGALNLGYNIQKSVLIGTDAGYTASNVGSTVAIGDRTLFVGSGSNNVYLGTSNGYSNLGSGNVFLGSMVGTTETAKDNTLYIGNQLGVLLHGDFASQKLGLNCVPASNFDVSGDTHLRGNVVIDGDLTVSGGPIGSDVCTGQVVLGIGASSSNYPSLIAVKGGIQLSDGFIQLNRTDGRDPVYRLDVSASARITGGSLIGGVTLSGTNVSTSGNVSISGNFSNIATSTNTIGGLTISNGNLVTSGTISGVFSNGSTSTNTIGGLTISNGSLVTSGTISGVFSNGLATSNSIAGITLGVSSGVDRIRLNASGANGGGEIKLFNGLNTVSETVAIFGHSVGGAGAVYISSLSAGGSSNGRIAGMRMDDDSNGGYLFLTNLSGTSNVEIFGRGGADAGAIALKNSNGSQTVAINGGVASGGGYFYVANSAATQTCTIYGDDGRIVNDLASSNSIGGALLSNSYLTNLSAVRVNLNRTDANPRGTLGVDSGGGFLTLNRFTDSAVTLTLSGSSGAISNLPASSNSIGGVALGSLTGTTLVRLGCNTSLDNGGSIQLFNSSSSNAVSINAVSTGGLLEIKNSTGSTVASINGGSDGKISNSTASSNIIGGVRLSNYEVTINYPVIGSQTGLIANTSSAISLGGYPTGIYVASVYYSTGCNVRGGSLTATIDWDNVGAIGGGTHQTAGGGQTMAIWTSNQFVYASADSNFNFVVKRALNRYDSLP